MIVQTSQHFNAFFVVPIVEKSASLATEAVVFVPRHVDRRLEDVRMNGSRRQDIGVTDE